MMMVNLCSKKKAQKEEFDLQDRKIQKTEANVRTISRLFPKNSKIILLFSLFSKVNVQILRLNTNEYSHNSSIRYHILMSCENILSLGGHLLKGVGKTLFVLPVWNVFWWFRHLHNLPNNFRKKFESVDWYLQQQNLHRKIFLWRNHSKSIKMQRIWR